MRTRVEACTVQDAVSSSQDADLIILPQTHATHAMSALSHRPSRSSPGAALNRSSRMRLAPPSVRPRAGRACRHPAGGGRRDLHVFPVSHKNVIHKVRERCSSTQAALENNPGGGAPDERASGRSEAAVKLARRPRSLSHAGRPDSVADDLAGDTEAGTESARPARWRKGKAGGHPAVAARGAVCAYEPPRSARTVGGEVAETAAG